MNILLLDTASSVFSMALTSGETVLAEYGGDAGPASSAKIPAHIQDLLQQASLTVAGLDGFAVTVGPGAFTGLRVGLALVKGLAYAAGKPVVPLSSLELLALNACGSDLPVCALFDARRGEVYSALYRFDSGLVQTRAELAQSPEQLLAEIDSPTLFIGDGALRYREQIEAVLGSRARFAADHQHRPRAAAGAALALSRLQAGDTVTPAELAPRYLRLAEAEIIKNQKRELLASGEING